jgi:hypothetical protein
MHGKMGEVYWGKMCSFGIPIFTHKFMLQRINGIEDFVLEKSCPYSFAMERENIKMCYNHLLLYLGLL